MTRSASSAQQARLAALWQDVRVGTPVVVRPTFGDPFASRTRSEPFLHLGLGVILIEGSTGPWSLDRVSLAGPEQPVVLATAAAPAAQSPALPDVDPVSSAGAVMLFAVSALTVIVGLKALLIVMLGGAP